MLTTRVNTEDTRINNLVISEDFTSDRDFYNSKLLSLGKRSIINGIVDSEIYEYKPERATALNFNLFFLRYIQDNEIPDLTAVMESGFTDQIYNTKVGLGIIHPNGNLADRGINNLFEIRQENNLREPHVLSDVGLSNRSLVSVRPYYSADPIGEAALFRPTKPGLPIFYNSYTFPFWNKKEKWITNDLLYKNKPFFYNSFLLMEVYDSPSPVTQKRLISIPIFVNARYNITEKNVTKAFTYERPCFNIQEGFEGFSFFFLNNYKTNTFYIRFSFWDALSGTKLPLLPSSKGENNKKWFQDTTTFKQETAYLKYVLNFTTKKYNIFEYDLATNQYDLNRTNFDLYELAFDPYYNNVFVANVVPVDAIRIVSAPEPLIPMKFSISNLIKDAYFPPTPNNVDVLSSTVSIDNSDSYLGMTASLVNAYASYVTTQTSQTVGFYNFKNNLNLTLPVINKNITGYNGVLANFSMRNIDTKDWTVTKVSFDNVIVSTEKNLYSNTFYSNKHNATGMLSESLTVLSTSDVPTSDTYKTDFTKELFFSVDFFHQFLKYIRDNRALFISAATTPVSSYIFHPATYNHNVWITDEDGNGGHYGNQLLAESYWGYDISGYMYNSFGVSPDLVADFLNSVFGILGIPLPPNHQSGFFGYKINPDNPSDISVSELDDYLPLIVSRYEEDKHVNGNNSRLIDVLMDKLLTTGAEIDAAFPRIHADDSLSKKTAGYVTSTFSAAHSPQYIDKYKRICAAIRDGLNLKDIEIVKKLNTDAIAMAIDSSNYDYEIRDFVFDTILTYNGASLVKPGAAIPMSLKFNIGSKANFNFIDSTHITVKGKVKISLLSGEENKYIYIPLNVGIIVGTPPPTSYLSNVTIDKQIKLNI